MKNAGIGITSFSKNRSSDWLLNTYGGSGNGAIVEFELPDIELNSTYHPVDYVSKRIFHIDIFLKNQAYGDQEVYRKILCTKTLEWQQENEIRFLGKTQNVPVKFDLKITKIFIGKNVKGTIKYEILKACDLSKITAECL